VRAQGGPSYAWAELRCSCVCKCTGKQRLGPCVDTHVVFCVDQRCLWFAVLRYFCVNYFLLHVVCVMGTLLLQYCMPYVTVLSSVAICKLGIPSPFSSCCVVQSAVAER
jgi:hypothetical protein